VRLRRRPRTAGRPAATAVDAPPPADRDTACWAPSTALYFQPDGTVRACCGSAFDLGRVGVGPGRRSLREIWQGTRLAAQRGALAEGRYDLGCQDCGVLAASGLRADSLAATFDRHGREAGDWPVAMDFALSNRCNLECVMCNGELSSTIRQRREHRPPLPAAYDDRFFDELAEFLPHLRRAQFKGGEPFLAPEAARVWELMARLAPDCETSVTTNGTVWNERVAEAVRTLRMQVNISVDGVTAPVLESVRVGVRSAELWANVERFQAATADAGSNLTLVFCLVRRNWHEAGDFLAECDRRGLLGEVIVATQPSEHSVLTLPPAEFRGVLDGLRSGPAGPGSALGANWGTWEALVHQLASHGATQVELRTSGTPAPDTDRRLRELAATAGTEPLAVVVDNGDLGEILARPDWAAGLRPEDWAGHRVFELPDLLRAAVGGDVEIEVDQGLEGESATRVRFLDAPGDGPAGLVAHFWAPPPGRSTPRVLAVVPVDG
jgi:MoaA/NifB/PqqE/SkfB family radical SAM enzyme